MSVAYWFRSGYAAVFPWSEVVRNLKIVLGYKIFFSTHSEMYLLILPNVEVMCCLFEIYFPWTNVPPKETEIENGYDLLGE